MKLNKNPKLSLSIKDLSGHYLSDLACIEMELNGNKVLAKYLGKGSSSVVFDINNRAYAVTKDHAKIILAKTKTKNKLLPKMKLVGCVYLSENPNKVFSYLIKMPVYNQKLSFTDKEIISYLAWYYGGKRLDSAIYLLEQELRMEQFSQLREQKSAVLNYARKFLKMLYEAASIFDKYEREPTLDIRPENFVLDHNGNLVALDIFLL